MGKHVALVRSKGEKPAKVLSQFKSAPSENVKQVPDKQNEALWCHLMMGGSVWQEVLAHREEEGRLVQAIT